MTSPPTAQQTDNLVAALIDALGADSVLTDAADRERFLVEERGLFRGEARIVLCPRDTEALAKAIGICNGVGAGIVPQGGNTGLVGGSVTRPDEVLVSLHRMNRICDVDPVNFTITLEAGVILADAQAAADEAGCLFPLSLGAEGSCTIGGNIASNAGGVGVLKYGNTRDLVLGLEVVLPDGRVWNGMRALYKDNSGYSLKNLFIGSEGSLGIVTKAVLKLFPQHEQSRTAFCALGSPSDALKLLSLARRRSGDCVTAFELMSAFTLSIVCDYADGSHPLESKAPWYALIELSSARRGSDLREVFDQLMEEAFEAGLISDAVIAESLEQAHRLWQLRESVPEAQKRAGGSMKHDISVPVSKVPDFITMTAAAVAAYMPDINFCTFGHVGDGNIHYNMTQPSRMTKSEFLSHWPKVSEIVYPIAINMGGSISAEHGIGLLKAEEMNSYRNPVESELMRRLKQAFDPTDIMNPGKMLSNGAVMSGWRPFGKVISGDGEA